MKDTRFFGVRAMSIFKLSLLLLLSLESYGVPLHMSYQGRLFDDMGEPLVQGSIAVEIEIRDPSGECLLYKEDHTINTLNTEGFFSLMLGSGSVHADSPPFGLSSSLANDQVLADAKLNCTGNSYTPSAGDHRRLRFFVDGQVLTPDQNLNSAPYAIQAKNSAYLNGKNENDFIQDDGGNVTQSKIQDFYDSAAGLGNNQSLRWNSVGSNWEAFTPGAAGAGINSVTAGAAINISGTASDPIVAVDETAIDYANLSNLPDLAGNGTSSIHFNNLTNVPMGLSDGDDDTTYTDAEMLAGVSNVDGSGSGLDSDRLDGQEGSHYLAWSNLTGVPADIADGDANTTYNNATGGAAGLMSSADKNKLDGLDGFSLNAADGSPADALYVDNAGYVGIGTATPSHRLTIEGGQIALDNNTGLVLKTSGGSQRLFFNVDSSDHLNIGNVGAGDGNDSIGFDVTSNNDVMYIDSSGFVGIGTTSPSNPLEVSDGNSGSAGGKVTFRNPSEAVGSSSNLYFATGSGVPGATNLQAFIRGEVTQANPSALRGELQFFTNGGDSPGKRMTITDSGDVGIGTAAPSAKLEVDNGLPKTNTTRTEPFRIMSNDASNPLGLTFYVKGDGTGTSRYAGIQATEVGLVSRNLTLNQFGGNVGIGHTNPGYPLHVNGMIHSSSGGFRLPDGAVIDEASDLGGGSEISFGAESSGTKAIGGSATKLNVISVEDFDIGNNFSSSRFTAPEAGRYHFDVSANMQGNICPSCLNEIRIYKNGSSTLCREVAQATDQGWNYVSVSCLLNLSTNDYVEVYAIRGNSTWMTVHTVRFTGHKIK